MEIWPGEPYPLGAVYDGTGTNFSLFSEVAEGVELCLFDTAGVEVRVALPEQTVYCWHGYPAWYRSGPALRLSRSRTLQSGLRYPLQPIQAALGSLREGHRGLGPMEPRRLPLSTGR